MRKKVPDILLEHLILGELAPDEAARVLSDLGKEEGGPERLEKMKKSNGEILAAYPVRSMAASIKQRVEESVRKEGSFSRMVRHFEMRYLLRPVPIAGILLFLMLAPWMIQRVFFYDAARIKGDGELFIYMKQGQTEKKLKGGDRVRKGDLLQVAYNAGEARTGVIFSVDGRGTVILHFPYQEKDKGLLEQGKKRMLRESYELDDAPLYEYFFFVYSSGEINTGSVLNRVRAMKNHPEKIKGSLRVLFKNAKVAECKLIKE